MVAYALFDSCPTRRSSDLVGETADGPVGSVQAFAVGKGSQVGLDRFRLPGNPERSEESDGHARSSDNEFTPVHNSPFASQDRKSTRLNSSHLVISYAVFCL